MIKLFNRIKKKYNSGIILMFHSLNIQSEKAIGTYSSKLTVTDFEEIIEYLSGYYKIISIEELVQCIKNDVDQDQFVAITFDDGYLDTYSCALPIIEKYSVPITIYITTNFIDKSTYPYEFILSRILERNHNLSYIWQDKTYEHDLGTCENKEKIYQEIKKSMRIMPDYERKIFFEKLIPNNLDEYIDDDLFMNWEQLQELKNNPLVTLGSHTIAHPQLDLIESCQAYSEIKQSKRYIEEKLKIKVDHFAYPYGGYNNILKNMVFDCNYVSAVTTVSNLVNKKSKSLMELPRKEVLTKESIINTENVNEMLKQ